MIYLVPGDKSMRISIRAGFLSLIDVSTELVNVNHIQTRQTIFGLIIQLARLLTCYGTTFKASEAVTL